MKQFTLIGATALLILSMNTAHAAFVSGAARWHAMGVEHKHSYVTAMASQTRACAKRRDISPANMSRAVSTYYSNHPARAAQPKAQVFEMAVVRKLCR